MYLVNSKSLFFCEILATPNRFVNSQLPLRLA